ncbi:hypothetical protein BDV96DRAFT_498198 [Lophiotrema nucula]|uniref:Uncharacterized protein n=1 Tax=Lophiotrema nucula TaxID=690887 RepID=A0A6A5YZA1_9PLEO|nr:hypothetical protein BDV96DRAFT_498198 [Lophiotrema nucula]
MGADDIDEGFEDDVSEVDSDDIEDEFGEEAADEGEGTAAQGPAKGHKRKKSAVEEEPKKAQKTEEPTSGGNKASPKQVLKFLLSAEALDVVRPEDEIKYIEEHGKEVVTYSNLLSPFEELLCAVVLSRPISHRLGFRSIRTILNPPYEFRTPEAIKEAGSEKVLQSLWDAKTQHKDKTADEIKLIADAVFDNDWSNDLEKIREKTKETVEKERELLRTSIKGLGKTGLDIFYRRIQWTWEEAYPFVDQRTSAAMKKLGLPSDTESLTKLIEEGWSDLEVADDGDHTGEAQKRRAFVLLLERAVGADLEGKIDQVLEEATKW